MNPYRAIAIEACDELRRTFCRPPHEPDDASVMRCARCRPVRMLELELAREAIIQQPRKPE